LGNGFVGFGVSVWFLSTVIFGDAMNQVARNTDPSTSWAAANAAKALAAQHATIIIQALVRYGAMGKDGIATITGLDGNQVARRLSELERNHEILLTGRNVQSKSGRAEREWKVMPKQMDLI
jgi:hypothetical protein